MKGGRGDGYSRRFVLGGLLAGAGQAALADGVSRSARPPPRPERLVPPSAATPAELLAATGLSGEQALAVADARSGRLLEVRNPVLSFPPASVTKLFTAQYALETLGPDHAFATRLLATGPVRDGRLEGDLVLLGGGDPMLDTDGLAELAAMLAAQGLREVAGRFRVHGGRLPGIRRIDPAQPEHLGYNPAISGLNLNFNRVYFEWKRNGSSYEVSMDARSERYRPPVKLARMTVVERKYPVYTYDQTGETEIWTVARAALGKGGARWLPVRQPELYAGQVFRELAAAQGLALPVPHLARGAVSGAVLAERRSLPLQSILRSMLYYSTNLIAEVCGLSATLARGGKAGSLSASAREMGEWARARLGVRKARFADHSGLNDASRLSASDTVQALLRIGPDSVLASIMKETRLRDERGNPIYDAPVKVVAKSGTLNFASNLAGFIFGDEGHDLAFAVFAADSARRASIPEHDRERPPGARGWNDRAHRLQDALLRRWAAVYLG